MAEKVIGAAKINDFFQRKEEEAKQIVVWSGLVLFMA